MNSLSELKKDLKQQIVSGLIDGQNLDDVLKEKGSIPEDKEAKK